MALTVDRIRRVHLGRFVRPAAETGTGAPRVEDVFGYLVRHDQGLVLLDTGIGEADEETEAWYRPRRVPLPEALATAGRTLDDVAVVVNCHLHFDHCGGNPLLAGRPVVCQRRELETARTTDYTIPELVDHPHVAYEEIDGETELLPGLHVMPTPGHVEGHQSLVVRCDDGTVILAGQSHESASDFAADVRAVAAQHEGFADPLPSAPAWLPRLLDLDPARVYFAHDGAVWEP